VGDTRPYGAQGDDWMKYRGIHSRLTRGRGKAADQECFECGAQALDWALKADLHIPGEKQISMNLEDYEPLCRRCHIHRDADPSRGFSQARALAIGLHERRSNDLEYDAYWRKTSGDGGKRTTTIRRTCAECGMTSNPGGLATHQKASSHRGFTA
jgi:hypothetical protein